jgi:uncharacterized protein (TIGR02099 family)
VNDPRRHRVLKWTLGTTLSLVVLLGIVMGLFGFVVGRVPEYRVQVQKWLSDRTGVVVEFRALHSRMRLYGPELVFDDAVVRTPDRTRVIATARWGSVGFDLWHSLWGLSLKSGRFTLEAPQFGLIRTADDRIQLLGQSGIPERPDAKPFAIENLPLGEFRVHNARVSFRDAITGRGPWSLSGISFKLLRTREAVRIDGDASLPSALGGRLEFTAEANGALEKVEDVKTSFSVHGDKLDLSGWADVLPDEWLTPETGQGSIKVSGGSQGKNLSDISAEIHFVNLTAAPPAWTIPLPTSEPLSPAQDDQDSDDDGDDQPNGSADGRSADDQANNRNEITPPAPEVLSYQRFGLRLRAQRHGDEWRVDVNELELSRPGSPWRSEKVAARWRRSNSGLANLHAEADRVQLQNLWPLLAYAHESPALAKMRALNPQGALENVQLDLVKEQPDSAAQFVLAADVRGLGVDPVARTPGISGLNGKLHTTEREGTFELAGREVVFTLPRMFRDRLTAQTVDGTVQWTIAPDSWTIGSDELRVQAEDGRSTAKISVQVPKDGGSPVLNLNAVGEDLKASATGKYVPANKLAQKTLEWFDRAFTGGQVTHARVSYVGPTRAFPFHHGEGEFLAHGEVQDATLNYQEGWAPAAQISAQVDFHNASMKVLATSARMGELEIHDAVAEIKDFAKDELVIKAETRGDVQHGLNFLKQSPVGPKLGDAFARLNGAGPMTARVNLFLPIKHLDDRRIEVVANVNGAKVALDGLNAPLQNLAGSLTVRNTLLSDASLKGQWLGGPTEIRIDQINRTSAALTASGRAQSNALRAASNIPASIATDGALQWSLASTLTTQDDPNAKRQSVHLTANLGDFAVELPEPIGKRVGEQRQLALDLDFTDEGVLARTSMDSLRVLARVRKGDDGWELDRAGVRADGIAPSLPDHHGLRIEGNIERFVLDDWLSLKGTGTGKRKLSDLLRAANVRIGSFELFGYRWNDVRGILQATDSGWRVDVSGPQAEGQLTIPENFTGALPLRASMERLVLAPADENVSNQQEDHPTDPRNFPALQVHVDDFQMGARKVGAIDLTTARVAQGMRIDSATVLSASVRAEGQGQWYWINGAPQSKLVANIVSNDVAATLRDLAYTPFIEAKRGEIQADISWPGGFDADLLDHASGMLAADVQGGQIVNLQPGAGRVLGLFSIGALPRRLALDFKDLTEKGLAFDSIHGDFELRNGNAFTSNTLLRGPAAEIGIAGRTGFGSRDYDQTAVVTGNLGASIPVAGAVVGGPAVGAALLLFSQVFKEPLKGITRGYYRITGPWDNPVVERIEAEQAKSANAAN